MSKKKRYKFVEFKWWDAHSVDDWVKEHELPKPAPIITRGWLLKETKNYIVLAGSHAPEDDGDAAQFGEVIAIPKGWGKLKVLYGRNT